MAENFYNILGIGEKSSQDEIKKAYRKMQMKWHPDKNPGNQEAVDMTQKINEAYETLSDERKREEYDNPNPFTRLNSMGGGSGMEVPVDDILNMFFGGANPFGAFSGMNSMGGVPLGSRIHVFNGSPMGFHQALQKPTPIIKSLNVNTPLFVKYKRGKKLYWALYKIQYLTISAELRNCFFNI